MVNVSMATRRFEKEEVHTHSDVLSSATPKPSIKCLLINIIAAELSDESNEIGVLAAHASYTAETPTLLPYMVLRR